MVLDAMVAGTFFVGGAIIGFVAAVAIVFTSWCYQWPRGVWK